ncbi:MAG: SufD family Fe-S cluster assembly protein [Steroidobacteraceae bacterium]
MTASAMTAPSRAPTNRDENWKYANVRVLSRLPFDQTTDDRADHEPSIELPAKVIECRLVLVDGRFSARLSDALPSGATVEIEPATADSAPITAAHGRNPVDLHYLYVNRTGRRETVNLRVLAKQRVQVEILHVATRIAQPAIRLQLEVDAELTLIERHLALGSGAAATNLALTVELAERSNLQLARWQHFVSPSSYIETVELSLDSASVCHLTNVTSADRGDTTVSSRSTAFVTHRGDGAELHWNSAVIADGQQQHDAYVRIDHQARRAQTHQLFRGIASGRSKIAFNGYMLVGHSAHGAHSGQSLKTLLAGSEAEANVRPQLEIYTNEVTATHGATVGKLDGDMLFYLLSRGIDAATAEALLKWAFVSDVLTHLPSAPLRHHIEVSLARQLPGAMASRESTI